MNLDIYKKDYQHDNNSLIKNNLDTHPRFERFMEIARSVSCLSNYDRYRLGAIIVLKGKIVSRGYNQEKTHPIQKKYNVYRFRIADNSNHFIHAEIDALNKAKGIDLSKAEIIIYHTGNNGEQKMARPCPGCMAAIKKSGIKKIHYSTPDGLATEYISSINITPPHKKKKF